MTERTRDIAKASGFCSHGNEPATCEVCNAERNALHKLLLTPEEEDAEARRRGQPPYLQHESDGEREITVFGTGHIFDGREATPIIEALTAAAPDVVFVEGEQWQRVDAALPDEEVLKKYGEQAYAARIAQKRGIDVRGWDLPEQDLIRGVRAHGKDAVLGWMVGQAAKHLLSQRGAVSADGIRELIRTFLGEGFCGGARQGGPVIRRFRRTPRRVDAALREDISR